MTQDQELLSFMAQVLEQRGGVVEQHSGYMMALLPARLSRQINLPEEVQIGKDGEALLYGSPLLDRIISLTTQEVPVVYGQLEVPYLKTAGFEQLLSQNISFDKGKNRIIDMVEARQSYMVLNCHYLAKSDELKEGLVEVVIHEDTGALIADMAGRWANFQPAFFPEQDVPPHFPVHLDNAIKVAMKSARSIVDAELADFFKSIKRHLHRDVRNTREYYLALKKEMKASLEKTNLSEEQRNERKAKIAELPHEMTRKIKDLKQKYQVDVTLRSCAALRFLVPVVRLAVEIRYRKLLREIRLLYNPITSSLDPLVCERCHTTTRSLSIEEKKGEIYLYCLKCG